jgi:hypothetical protein
MRPLRTKELIRSILIDWYFEGRQSDELTELVTDFGRVLAGSIHKWNPAILKPSFEFG